MSYREDDADAVALYIATKALKDIVDQDTQGGYDTCAVMAKEALDEIKKVYKVAYYDGAIVNL